MSVVDTSTWKPFRVGDLFNIQKGRRLTKADMVDGDYPFVGASAVGNGVTAFIGNDACLRDGHCLTVCYNGSVGETFLQKEPFWASDDVNVLRPFSESVSDFALMFVAPCIRSLRCNYGYTNKWTSAKMAEDIILLPATPDGEPDWAYMETYMRQVLDREEMFAEHLASLTAEAVADGHVIDTSAWKAFKVGDLFDVLLAKGDIQPNLVGDGDVPLVSAGTADNGIVATISGKGDGISEVFPAGCLTVSMFGTAFWQTETFYAVSHGRVNVLMPKCRVSDMVGLFLTSAVNACFNGEYDYSTMCTRKRLLDTTVTLPATSDGAPDWAYMEQYMKDVMAVEALFADELDRVYCA